MHMAHIFIFYSLICVNGDAVVDRERERELMSEAALNFRQSKEENGIRLEGFEKWCTTENDTIRLRILDWLKSLGNEWLQVREYSDTASLVYPAQSSPIVLLTSAEC